MRLREFRLSLIAIAATTLALQPSCARPAAPATSQPEWNASVSPAVKKIAEFQGPNRFLSNFWPAMVEFEGLTYPSVEHAYQAAKTLDVNERKKIAAMPTPSDAKKAGRALKSRDDWEQVKFDVMETCVRYKFTHHADLAAQLLATGDALLEEGNTWGDRTWGVYQGQGENRLGKILMKIRGELRAQEKNQAAK